MSDDTWGGGFVEHHEIVKAWMRERPGLSPCGAHGAGGRDGTQVGGVVWIEDSKHNVLARARYAPCTVAEAADYYVGALVAVSVAEGFAMLARGAT